MIQMYFLVEDENELKDKIWENFFDDLMSGAVLGIEELPIEEDDERLFRVWVNYVCDAV